MPSNRREFLKVAAAAAPATLLAGTSAGWSAAPAKKLLILGGTAFLGPELVEAAQARGWTVTLFNRGKTRPGLFPELEKLRGDRDATKDEGLKALEGRSWDAVVDTSGYVPRHVRDSATLLAKNVKQYVFISTISVYSDNSKPGMDETAALGKLDDPTIEKVDGATYGPLKAGCEQAAEAAMPGRTTIIRPGLIVGPGDPTDRFTYWPVRIAKGGEVLAPGDPKDPVQFIDVRDLAAFAIKTIEDGTVGVFNATGPKSELSIGELLASCRRTAASEAALTWVEWPFLDTQKVAPWQDMPVWVPPLDDMAGFARVSIARALAKGISFRPLDETTRDTLAWWRQQPEARRAKLRAGIAPEREAEVLKAWRERPSAAPKG